MTPRKAAFALTVSAMGLSTAAFDHAPQSSQENTQSFKVFDDEGRAHPVHLSSSEAFKEALIEEEGVRKTVYRDVAGYPTVGVGHLIRPEDGLRVGDRIGYDQVLDFLEDDLKTAEAGVKRLLGDLKVTQAQFDAMVDLVYNVGEGNVSPKQSPRLNAAIDAADYEGIASELHYHTAGGAKAKGLVYRSMRRAQMFMDGKYDNPRPDQA